MANIMDLGFLKTMVWSETFTYLIIIVVMLLLLRFKNYLRSVYLAFKFPGPPALPLLGNVLLVTDSKKLESIAINMSELFGPIMRIWISITPIFVISEPQDLQLILGTSKNSTKNIFYALLHNFIGKGLITHTGQKWKEHRKLMQPYFHINFMKTYFRAFHKCSISMVENLKDMADIDVTPLANKFALDVLHDSVLGISVENSMETSPFRKGEVLVPYRVTRPWLLLDTIFKVTNQSKRESKHRTVLQDYTKNIIDNKRKEIQEKKITTRDTLMEMMIEIAQNNPKFSEEDVVNETSTFMLAGQESIGTALAFCLHYIALDQDVQDKIIEELNGIFKGSNRLVDFEDVIEMKYLEQCIKEALRLCPSIPILARKLTKDVVFRKQVFPAGTNILISPFLTHRLPHIFPNPLKFDPERFSPENITNIHPYAFLPFSAGPRNCIGYKFALLEMKTVVSHILRSYHLSITPGHEELNLAYRITLRAKGGIWLRLRKRNTEKIN